MRMLFGIFALVVMVSIFIVATLWEMFDNEEGIDD